jgi:hypothetical protein
MANVHTITQWMAALAVAMADRELAAIEDLRRVTTDWLQPEAERTAQLHLLDAATDLIDAVDSAE